jgi:hypothetical protein
MGYYKDHEINTRDKLNVVLHVASATKSSFKGGAKIRPTFFD